MLNIIIEIHESTPHLMMSRKVLDLYRMLNVGFAIDDIGLNMNDILRLSEFEGMAEYIKIDRHCVCAQPDASNSLKQVMSFIQTLIPESVIVAEGVRNAKHAMQIHKAFPEIKYVQGLYLPASRKRFLDEYKGQSDGQNAPAPPSKPGPPVAQPRQTKPKPKEMPEFKSAPTMIRTAQGGKIKEVRSVSIADLYKKPEKDPDDKDE